MTSRNVLFVCHDNTSLSIMAAAYLAHAGRGIARAYSAGLEPGSAVHPLALEMLSDVGLRTGDPYPKSLSIFQTPGAPDIDVLVVLQRYGGPRVEARMPGIAETFQWFHIDPPSLPGTFAQRKSTFLSTFAELRTNIDGFLLSMPGVVAA